MQAAEAANGTAIHPAAEHLRRAADHLNAAASAMDGQRPQLWAGAYDRVGQAALIDERIDHAIEKEIGPSLDKFAKKYRRRLAALEAKNAEMEERIKYLEALAGARDKQ